MIQLPTVFIALLSWCVITAWVTHRVFAPRFWPAFALLWSGVVMGAVICIQPQQSFINLVLGLELAHWSAMGLLMLWRTPNTLESVIKYSILHGLGTMALLWGWSDYALEGGSMLVATTTGQSVAGLWLLGGLLLQLGVVPFHWAVPDIYTAAPWPALLGVATVGKWPVLGILRQWHEFLQGVVGAVTLAKIYFVLGLVSLVWGQIGAWKQKHVGRLLGYASIAQSGLWLLTLSIAGPTPVLDLLMASYFVALCLLCVACAHLSHPLDSPQSFQQLGRSVWVQTAFGLAIASWIGVPPSPGFYAKWLLLEQMSRAVHPVWAFATLMLSLLGAAYYGGWVAQSAFVDHTARSVPISRRQFFGIVVLSVLFLGWSIWPVASTVTFVGLKHV